MSDLLGASGIILIAHRRTILFKLPSTRFVTLKDILLGFELMRSRFRRFIIILHERKFLR